MNNNYRPIPTADLFYYTASLRGRHIKKVYGYAVDKTLSEDELFTNINFKREAYMGYSSSPTYEKLQNPSSKGK